MSSIGAGTLERETERMYNKGMKLTATQKKKLTSVIRHVTGGCGCSPNSKTCIYWKLVDKGGDDWQAKEIIKVIEHL